MRTNPTFREWRREMQREVEQSDVEADPILRRSTDMNHEVKPTQADRELLNGIYRRLNAKMRLIKHDIANDSDLTENQKRILQELHDDTDDLLSNPRSEAYLRWYKELFDAEKEAIAGDVEEQGWWQPWGSRRWGKVNLIVHNLQSDPELTDREKQGLTQMFPNEWSDMSPRRNPSIGNRGVHIETTDLNDNTGQFKVTSPNGNEWYLYVARKGGDDDYDRSVDSRERGPGYMGYDDLGQDEDYDYSADDPDYSDDRGQSTTAEINFGLVQRNDSLDYTGYDNYSRRHYPRLNDQFSVGEIREALRYVKQQMPWIEYVEGSRATIGHKPQRGDRERLVKNPRGQWVIAVGVAALVALKLVAR